jgi:hypothetical protein
MSPYRANLHVHEDEGLRRAAAVDLARRNLERWRNAFIVLTALAGIGPWIHLPQLAAVQLGAAVLALGCAVEHWRRGREVRELLKPVAASPPPRAPR